MNQDTQKLIDKVEKVTGYRVSIGSVNGINGYAQMITATENKPMHIININQSYAHVGDYVVALQCAMLLAKWTDPKRIPVFVTNQIKVSYQIEKASRNKKLQNFPIEIARQYASQIINGLIHQLLSQPIEMISIDICRRECPSLSSMMSMTIRNEIQEFHQVFKPEIKKITPEEIFVKNVSMSAAFTLNWSRISGEENLLVPFIAANVLEEGKELLKIYDSVHAEDPRRYLKTVNLWAEKLNMTSFYKWEYRNE